MTRCLADCNCENTVIYLVKPYKTYDCMLLIDLYVFLVIFITSSLYQTYEIITISLQMQNQVSMSQSDSSPRTACRETLLMTLLYIPLKCLP